VDSAQTEVEAMDYAKRVAVAIIGAGPVGLTAAAELARHGVTTRIVERRDDAVAHSQAAVIHVRTQEVFEAMGAAERIVPRGFPLDYMSLHAFGKLLGGICVRGVDGPYPGPRIIGQRQIELLLAEHLAALGAAIDRPADVTDIVEAADGFTVTLARPDGTGDSFHADYIIGCDGGRSFVRERFGIGFPGESYDGFEFIHADAQLRWSYPTGRGYIYVTKDRLLLLLPFDAVGHYRVLCARTDQNPNNRTLPELAELQTILREVSGDGEAELTDASWLARWRSTHRIADSFRRGRVFLAGDAGHIHVPVGGQGMNTGIQDSFNLAWKLAAVINGVAVPALLDSYEDERYPVAEDLLKGTDRGFHLMVQPGDLASFALKLFGSGVIALEAVQDRLRRLLGEVTINYRQSALAEDHGGSIGPIAGDRALDGVVVRAVDRRTLRLLEAISGPRWSLLIFTGAEAESGLGRFMALGQRVAARFGRTVVPILVTPGTAPATWPGTVLHDRDHLLHERYGVLHAVLYLIRPDWYVGFRAPVARDDLLISYLDRWLIAESPG
jgi:2-polyprenyl-6-methoxyphenol hydroxylase-like FAD-dependent oxidoreductase